MERNSLNSVLLKLGFPRQQAYSKNPNCKIVGRDKTARQGHLYEHFTEKELRAIIKELKRKAVKLYHPDNGGTDIDKFVKVINLAKKAEQILNYKFHPRKMRWVRKRKK